MNPNVFLLQKYSSMNWLYPELLGRFLLYARVGYCVVKVCYDICQV